MDLPVEAADWLVHFRNQNLPFLKDIKVFFALKFDDSLGRKHNFSKLLSKKKKIK